MEVVDEVNALLTNEAVIEMNEAVIPRGAAGGRGGPRVPRGRTACSRVGATRLKELGEDARRELLPAAARASAGTGSPRPENGMHSRTSSCARPCPRPSAPLAPQVDRLRGDDELDRGDPLSELDQLGESAGSERRHRHPVLDSLRVRGARDLERHRLREEPRLGDERLADHAELGQRVLGEPALDGEPLGQPGERKLEELDQPLVRARQDGCERDPQEVERRARAAGRRSSRPRRSDPRPRARAGSPARRSARPQDCPPRTEVRRARRPAPAAGSGRRADPGGSALRPPPRASSPRGALGAVPERRAAPGSGRTLGDPRVEGRQVGRKRLEVERARDVERQEEPPRVRDRERRQPGREGVVVERARCPPWQPVPRSPEEPMREVGHRRQVGLAE